MIKEFNLETVKIEELDFLSDFELKITKKSYLNSFVLWFDTLFTHGTKEVILSTSPFKKSTHWKQTIFYLNKKYPVSENDIIKGTINIHKDF